MSENQGDRFDEDYFLRGRATGKSLYEDYRWMPEATIQMAERITDYCGICRHRGDTILDFGCARGYVVKALRSLGYNAWGYDVSAWALANADPEVKPYLIVNDSCLFSRGFDWVIAKDVLEHVQHVPAAIRSLMEIAGRGVFVVVPLAPSDDCDYVIPDYERDVTHLHRWCLPTWSALFMRPGWRVEVSYRVPGIKDNWYRSGWERGNGFILARRVEE